MGALGDWNTLIGESVEAVGGSSSAAIGRSGSCCLALSKLYEAGPFRQWWGEAAARAGAAERLQWLDYRAKGVDLIPAALAAVGLWLWDPVVTIELGVGGGHR